MITVRLEALFRFEATGIPSMGKGLEAELKRNVERVIESANGGESFDSDSAILVDYTTITRIEHEDAVEKMRDRRRQTS